MSFRDGNLLGPLYRWPRACRPLAEVPCVCARSKWRTMLSAMLAASLLCVAPAGAAEQKTPSDAAASSSSGPPRLASDAWLDSRAVQTRLSSGAVAVHTVVNGKPSRGTVEAAIRIHASAREIWPFITQCRYAAWLIPGLKRCRTLETAQDGSWADIEHIIQYSLFTPTMHSVFRAEFHPPYRMDFHRIGGNLKNEVGGWSLLPSAGDATTVVYRVSLQPGFWIPKFVVRRMLHKQLPAALRSLRKHSQELAATESSPHA
ncbi:MAG TPA: SRPBCC family protein [Steroidobacteraceae bacterium]|nr:SRPBCC family protein [Steroidobacteraceae bacterium]